MDTEGTKPKPELQEFAYVMGNRDVTRGYVDPLDLLIPQNASQLRNGGGRELYNEVLRDDRVGSTLQQRALALVSREWEVLPGDESPQAKKAAQLLEETLKRINWDRVTQRMLWAVLYGFSVAECIWERSGDEIRLKALRVRDANRFAFGGDMGLRLLTQGTPRGEAVPERKFWTVSANGIHDDDPYGLGLAYWLYWPVFFKHGGMRLWMIFLEKFGSPTAIGRYGSQHTDEERRRLLQALNAIRNDSGIIVPNSMEVTLLDASRSGKAGYLEMIQKMDATIAQIILGQTMTSDDGSSLSQAEVHYEVRQDLIEADADLIDNTFNATVAQWVTDFNFPPGTPYPTVRRIMEEPEDKTAVAGMFDTMARVGFRPTLEEVKRKLGGEWEPIKPEAPEPQTSQPPAKNGAAFAERPDEHDLADRYSSQLQVALQSESKNMLEQVRTVLNGVSSLAEAQAVLLNMYPSIRDGHTGETLGDALLAAGLGGRQEVVDEAAE